MQRHTKRKAKARRRNGANSVVIQITTTQNLIAVLDCVVQTGFFGTSRAAAAERLLAESIRGLLKEGTIQKRQKVFCQMKHPWDLDSIKVRPDMEANRCNRALVYRWVRDTMRLWYPDYIEQGGRCLHWTHAGCWILRLCGYRAILQAGTMNWPIAPDRGHNNTHFSYEWQPEHWQSVAAIAQGKLPEVHIWIGLPDEGMIVDFSTGLFKSEAVLVHRLNWELEAPPRYLWRPAAHLPPGVRYRPIPSAIAYIIEHLKREPIEA